MIRRTAEEKELLLRTLGRIGADPGTLDEIASTPGIESFGPPLDDLGTGLEGLRRLQEGREVGDDHLDALEAIILPLLRPVLFVQNDGFGELPDPWCTEVDRPAMERAIRGVGRIELTDHPLMDYVGTGILVGPGVVATNRHVAEQFSVVGGGAGALLLPHRSARVDLRQERLPASPVRLAIEEVLHVHAQWDIALLRTETPEDGRAPTALVAQEPEPVRERAVAAIGYPGFDPKGDAEVQHRVFRGTYGCKRLQPGRLTGYQEVRSYGHTVRALAHDCSTLGGNSGSAVVDLGNGDLLGIHFAGRYLDINYAVPAWELAADPEIARLVAWDQEA